MNTHTYVSQDALFDHMRQRAIIVTPNNRLSNQLSADFYKQQLVDGIEKPLCLPYQAFLNQLFKQTQHKYPAISHPVLLTSLQERHLWRFVIMNSEINQNDDGLLDKIIDAWSRCQQWQIPDNHPLFKQTPQCAQFQQWANSFKAHLESKHAITAEQLVPYLIDHPQSMSAQTIIWACFDDYTPIQMELQRAIAENGHKQYHYDIEQKPINTQQFAAENQRNEWLTIVQWLKACLNQGDKKIAVVVPDLQTQCKAIQRFFQAYFLPEEISISLGNPLTEHPIVSHAIACLGLGKKLKNHQVRLLLHSPFLACSQNELMARSEFMQYHYLMQEETMSLSALIEALNTSVPKLASLLSTINHYPEEASIDEWIDHFKTRLMLLGFPGDYPLQSETYQYVNRFMTLFDEFLQLSSFYPTISQHDALQSIDELANKTIFQPKSPSTPIQILGLLEASGCTFDSVWISGLTDQCLPQKTNFSALIPIELQKQLSMPHARPERELQFAQQTLQRLQYASHQTMVSYPKYSGDIPNLPSPLITHFPLVLNENQPEIVRNLALIQQEEHYLFPFTDIESLSGGTAILANQAKCPFRAFSAHRLHAKRAALISQGPDASERGQVVHHVMEMLWTQLKNQHTLNAQSQDALNQLIEEAVFIALKPMVKKRQFSFPKLIQDIEHVRLKKLVTACLTWEKNRPPFSIEALEKTFTIDLSGLQFNIRVDRIDHNEFNEKWIIDYKTSIPLNKPWNEERPEAPQLLLYALVDEAINTLLFIELKHSRIHCSGLSEEALPIKGVSTLKKDEKWHDRQEQWRKALSLLAEEFKQGQCLPIPTRHITCQTCEFQNLCRI